MKVSKLENLTDSEVLTLMHAGIVGTLADSSWFSSVEAKVYVISSFFTAIVVWGMLKWEVIEGEEQANRWLISLFCTVGGLSIGVRLLNLATILALRSYYLKKYKELTFWGRCVHDDDLGVTDAFARY